jgi:hypothetical protein
MSNKGWNRQPCTVDEVFFMHLLLYVFTFNPTAVNVLLADGHHF